MELLYYLLAGPTIDYLFDHGISGLTLMKVVAGIGLALGIVSKLPIESWVKHRKLAPRGPSTCPKPESSPPPAKSNTDPSWIVTTQPDGTEIWELGDGLPARPRQSGDESEVEFLKRRLQEELRAAWEARAMILEPPAARVAGRVARIEPHDPEAAHRLIWLAVPDEGGSHQAIKVKGDVANLGRVAEGDHLQLALTWHRGKLIVTDIEEHIPADELPDPMPEVALPDASQGKVPDWFNSNAKNEKRPMLKASDGSSSVSELRVHLVWATKRRGTVLTAVMVDRLKALTSEVVAQKNLGKLLAVNGEADHVHVALWLPANLAGSEAAGHIKSYTSRLLRKEFPELLDHDGRALWQRGCYVGSIGQGGDLAGVLRYIANQSAPQTHEDDSEGALGDLDQEEDS